MGWSLLICTLKPQNPSLKVTSDPHMILIVSLRKRNTSAISTVIICWKLHPEIRKWKFQVKIRQLSTFLWIYHHEAQSWPALSPSELLISFLCFSSMWPHNVSKAGVYPNLHFIIEYWVGRDPQISNLAPEKIWALVAYPKSQIKWWLVTYKKYKTDHLTFNHYSSHH